VPALLLTSPFLSLSRAQWIENADAAHGISLMLWLKELGLDWLDKMNMPAAQRAKMTTPRAVSVSACLPVPAVSHLPVVCRTPASS